MSSWSESSHDKGMHCSCMPLLLPESPQSPYIQTSLLHWVDSMHASFERPNPQRLQAELACCDESVATPSNLSGNSNNQMSAPKRVQLKSPPNASQVFRPRRSLTASPILSGDNDKADEKGIAAAVPTAFVSFRPKSMYPRTSKVLLSDDETLHTDGSFTTPKNTMKRHVSLSVVPRAKSFSFQTTVVTLSKNHYHRNLQDTTTSHDKTKYDMLPNDKNDTQSPSQGVKNMATAMETISIRAPQQQTDDHAQAAGRGRAASLDQTTGKKRKSAVGHSTNSVKLQRLKLDGIIACWPELLQRLGKYCAVHRPKILDYIMATVRESQQANTNKIDCLDVIHRLNKALGATTLKRINHEADQFEQYFAKKAKQCDEYLF